MPVTIPDSIVGPSGMTEQEFRREFALWLYQSDKVSLMWAAKFAGLDRMEFHDLLAEREIPINYGVEEFHEDLATLRRLGQL